MKESMLSETVDITGENLLECIEVLKKKGVEICAYSKIAGR